MTKNKSRWAAGLAAATLVAVAGCEPGPQRVSESRYQAVLDEIMGVEFVFQSPTPDGGSRRLAYIHAAPQGRGLFVLDLKTLERKEVAVTNEVVEVSGWSPDGQYLAFVQSPVAPPKGLAGNVVGREMWVTLLDSESGAVSRLTAAQPVKENHFLWLTASSYVYSHHEMTNDYGEIYMGSLGRDVRKKVSNYRDLVVMGDALVGHAENGNILSLEVKPLKDTDKGTSHSSRTVRPLSEFGPKQFDQMRWLRYSRENGTFLFCARPANSTWRYLFQFDPRDKRLTKLNDEDTYNGQWLQGGSGFAYVGNTNNSFFLAVRPRDPAGRTNLFTRGAVVNYTVAPDGERIYVTASLGVEPQGLWEYTVTDRSLRRVMAGAKAPFVASRIIEPEEYRVKSFDGLEIPCYLFRPAGSGKGGDAVPTGGDGQKWPAVIFLSPRTGQFQRAFDARAELLANLGFCFVAVNYRGCDGYGRDYASLGDTAGAAGDILAVREDLLKRETKVDGKRVFLASSSDGSVVTCELLARKPELWRGVAMDSPSGAPAETRLVAGKVPPIFFSTGDLDPALGSLSRFAAWARANGVEVSSVTYTNSGHFNFQTSQRRDKLARASRFMLDHL